MILLESSVLMQAQRLPNSEESKQVASLIISGEAAVTGPVVMEYLRGARTDDEFEFLTERISAIDFLEVDQQTWVWAGRLSRRYMRAGMYNVVKYLDAQSSPPPPSGTTYLYSPWIGGSMRTTLDIDEYLHGRDAKEG